MQQGVTLLHPEQQYAARKRSMLPREEHLLDRAFYRVIRVKIQWLSIEIRTDEKSLREENACQT